MKSIWKLLALGITVIFLFQSCMTVRPLHRCHHHHRHCLVAKQPTNSMILSDLSITDYPVISEFMVYGNNG